MEGIQEQEEFRGVKSVHLLCSLLVCWALGGPVKFHLPQHIGRSNSVTLGIQGHQLARRASCPEVREVSEVTLMRPEDLAAGTDGDPDHVALSLPLPLSPLFSPLSPLPSPPLSPQCQHYRNPWTVNVTPLEPTREKGKA